MNQSGIRIDMQTREETDDAAESLNRYRTNSFYPFGDTVGTFPWHWHPEVECFYMQEGSLTYHIPGQECTFRKGDVGFVNAGVLHMLSDTSREMCKIQNHIFLPQMICGENKPLETKYIMPLVLNTAASLMIFRAESEEADMMRRWMDEAHHAHISLDFAHELTVRDCMSRVWSMLIKNMPSPVENGDGKESLRLMNMIEYIGGHYAEKLTLEALASAAHIGTKECERCFRRQIMMSPFEYIMEYRLERARIMLWQNREISVTEIGQACGFTTTSYFGKCFREKYGMSPSEYRKGYAVNS